MLRDDAIAIALEVRKKRKVVNGGPDLFSDGTQAEASTASQHYPDDTEERMQEVADPKAKMRDRLKKLLG